MMNKKQLLLCFAALFFMSFSQGTWALSCFAGSGLAAFQGKNGIQTATISDQVLVPTGFTTTGTILWRSQTYTSAFTCFDTDNQPNGENAFLYWDPQRTLSSIHPSIQVGITINGMDFPLIAGNGVNLAPGTVTPATLQNCRDIGISRLRCATPRTLNFGYTVFVKATGAAPPTNGQIPNPGSVSLFQVDGSGGLNGRPNSNFNLYLSGLNNIRFVECNPQITINSTNGNTVDFGRVVTQTNAVNQIINRKNFNIRTDLSRSDTGGVCNGKVLMASFSATNSQNLNTILPANRTDIGIQLFQKGGTTPIQFRTPYEISTINGGIASNDFEAGLIQLSPSPAVGRFNATAVVEVTFK